MPPQLRRIYSQFMLRVSVSNKIKAKEVPPVTKKPVVTAQPPIKQQTPTPAKHVINTVSTGNKIESEKKPTYSEPAIIQTYAPQNKVVPKIKIETPVIIPGNSTKIDNMRWKPKTVAGKIIKGAVIGGGSILGLASGIGIVGGAVNGVGAAKGAAQGIGGLVKVVDKVGVSAVNLVTGTTKDERQQIAEIKKETKAEQDKLEQVQRLIHAGATPEKAKSMVGIQYGELKTINGKEVQKTSLADMFSNPVVKYAAFAIGGFFILKALKIIK